MNKSAKLSQNFQLPFWLKSILVIIPILAILLLITYFSNFHGSFGNQGDFGTFGDFVGGLLNPLLGFATVGLLIWSLGIQSEELTATRETLDLTRQELAETKKETALSRKALQEQLEHSKKESKLIEIQRLISSLISEYEAGLEKNIFNTKKWVEYCHDLYPDEGLDSVSVTFGQILDFQFKIANSEVEDNLRKYVAFSYEHDVWGDGNQWRMFESRLVTVCNLYIRYIELSDSHDFFETYNGDFYLKMVTLNNVLKSEHLESAILRLQAKNREMAK